MLVSPAACLCELDLMGIHFAERRTTGFTSQTLNYTTFPKGNILWLLDNNFISQINLSGFVKIHIFRIKGLYYFSLLHAVPFYRFLEFFSWHLYLQLCTHRQWSAKRLFLMMMQLQKYSLFQLPCINLYQIVFKEYTG